MAPALERVQAQYAGRVALRKINADAAPDEVQALNVFGIPTLIVMRDGKEITRRTGAQSAEALTALFEAALTAQPPAPGPTRADRALRLFAALALLVIGMMTGPSVVLLAASGAVTFSAVYDRCPLWRALVRALVRAMERRVRAAG